MYFESQDYKTLIMIIKRDFFSIFYKFLKNLKLKPLLGFGQKLAAEGEVYLGLKRADHPPLLIYQMGKVGSTSVSRSLHAAGLKNYVFDIHFLSKDLIKYRNFYIDSGIVPVPYHIELGLALRKRIINNNFNKLKIISMVRDPIARQISDVFQNPELMETNTKKSSGSLNTAKLFNSMEKKFSDASFYDYIFSWFDKELKAMFGIDVFSHPFDCDSGWTIYKADNVDALIIRLEDLSRIGEDVISEFLGTPQKISLVSANVRSESQEAEAYRYVQNNFKIDRAISEKIYDSRFARHFYSGDQIESMINRWI